MRSITANSILAGLITANIAGCSLFFADEREPYYPLLRNSTYSGDDIAVIETDNVLKSAVKHNDFVLVEDGARVNQSVDKVFAEAINNHSVSVEDLKGEEFHQGLELIIKQFTCELYASQQPVDSIQLCPQSNQVVDNGLGYLPFEKGVRTAQRLSAIERNDEGTLQLELFLKSTHERPLESLWGAVHELGYFKGSQLPPESVVLTINLKAYKKDTNAHNWRYLHSEPLIFFVVLPSVDQLINRPNEVESMKFAYRSAKLLVVDSR
ncbi:hypothetical protein [Vibrio bivalvicida]|uniref:Lipoprotein n=1 Tax=Vibrio bivalvicida TaxID=1276888 RepID=A0ABV4MHV5_9VIBR